MFFLTRVLLALCLIALAIGGVIKSDNKNLISVVQIFRHGHRTPVNFYANDRYADKKYWNGLDLGQLTNIGKRQHEELGKFSRRRYGGWLPSKYDRKDIYVQTTDVDRTHMSAQANLYGLYPASGDQIWKRFLDWQPIPVHIAPTDIFDPSSFSCTNYVREFVRVFSTEEYVKLDQKYSDLLKYLTKNSGSNLTTIFDVLLVDDCFKCEEVAKLRLPSWSKAVYPNPLRSLSGYGYKAFASNTKQQRLFMGPLLNTIVQHFENIANGSTTLQKYQIYSGHDSNIAGLLSCFGAFEPPYPPAFASSIYIELRKGNNGLYINVWSKNDNDFKQISVRGCALDCPISEFKQRLSEIIVDANIRNAECEQQDPVALTQENEAFLKKILGE